MNRAFSLVELSIVLVILGLLVGGVLSGQSLIHASELKATTNQFANYRSAIYTFRDKYFALPGDMNNATSFWGSAGGAGNDAACFNAQTAGAQATCNGDGDGYVAGLGALGNAERYSSWKQLANAGLVEGAYTGVSSGGAGTYTPVPGSNVPLAKAGNAYFDITQITNGSYPFLAAGTMFNSITLYGLPANTYGALKPEDAWNIDTKFDDGLPYSGAYFTTYKDSPVAPNCTNSDLATATYDFTQTSKNCLLASKL